MTTETRSEPSVGLVRNDASPMPAYEPRTEVSGPLTAWGDPAFEELWKGWTAAFNEFHPKVKFDHFLAGTSTAVGALYTKTADIGLFGREIRRLEKTSWKRVFSHQPLGFAIATGSFDVFAKTVSIAMLVNRENPLESISLPQLDAIYSRDRRRGAAEPIRTWGQLGLGGEWENAPIRLYGLDPDTGTAQHFRMRVLLDGRWTDEISLPAGAPTEMYAGSGGHAAEALVSALQQDGFALGIAGFRNRTGDIKALALAETDEAEAVEGTVESTRTRRYPLSRSVYAFVREKPDSVWDPKVAEFTRFLLSREGQAVVASEGEYQPLPASLVVAERDRIAAR